MPETSSNHTELVQKILSGARWASLFRASAQVFSWLSTLIIVRFLTPEDYGLNSMLEAPLDLIMLFSTLGLDIALVQRQQILQEEIDNTFGFLLLLNFLLFLSFFFGGPLLSAYFDEPQLTLLSQVLAFIFLLIPFRVIPNALLDRALKFRLKAKIELAASILTALTTLTLAYLGAGIWALVIGFLVNRSSQAILLMIIHPWFIIPKFQFSQTKKMIKFGSLLILSSFFTRISDMSATIVAGPYLGSHLLGIYAIASSFAILVLSKGMPVINQTMVPAFSKFQHDRNAATYYFEKLFGVVSILFIPTIIGTACVANAFILTIAGAEWEQSIIPLQIMSIGVIFRMTNNLYSTVITAMGRSDLRLKSSVIQITFIFPLIILNHDHGVIGLVIAWVVAEFMAMITNIEFSKRILNSSFKSYTKMLSPALISSLFMAICVIAIMDILQGQHQAIILGLQILTGFFTYLFLLRISYRKQLLIVKHAIFGEKAVK